MKRFISVLVLCSLILLLFTSCMSDKQKQQARENEEAAKTLIESYVKENYNGASIENVECLTSTGGMVFPETFATDYVKATVSHNGKRFKVVVGLETGEFFNNYQEQKITEELEELLFDEISVQKPNDVEIKFASRDLMDSTDDEIWSFVEKSIGSAEDLLRTNKYKVFVVFKYANSGMDFETIPIKSFFKEEYTSDIEIAFVNYRNLIRYDNDDVIYNDCTLSSLFIDEEAYYNISDIRLATQLNEENWGSDEDVVEELVYNEDYKHYKSQSFNDIEFIWNDEYYDVEFSEINAEPIVTTEYYSGDPFYATNKTAVKLNCTKITDKEMYYDNQVYMYFDGKLYGDYIIVENNSNVDIVTLDWRKNGYVYTYEVLQDSEHDITIGFYERGKAK